MLVLFVIVAAAVLTVTWSRWENLPKWILRMCGMLSIALGVRTVALLTVFLLVPVFPQFAWSDEPVPAAETGNSDTPTAESKTPELPAAERKAMTMLRQSETRLPARNRNLPLWNQILWNQMLWNQILWNQFPQQPTRR